MVWLVPYCNDFSLCYKNLFMGDFYYGSFIMGPKVYYGEVYYGKMFIMGNMHLIFLGPPGGAGVTLGGSLTKMGLLRGYQWAITQ